MKLSIPFFGFTTAWLLPKPRQVAAPASADSESVENEHRILVRQYGQVQLRCSELAAAQAQEVARLQACVMRLRADVMIRETSLAFEREERAELDAVLTAADLVICQTGCVSHDAYWRVQDHCKRTGKRCVLVDQPMAIQVMMASTDPVQASSPICDCK